VSNAETLSRLEAANLDIPEECACLDRYGPCSDCAECFICTPGDDEPDSWELAVREERERLGD